jgi:beta-mannosidase
MNQFSVKSDWSLQSKVMKHHQKSYVGNGMIEKHANLLFGKTKDFEQFVYYSQLTQAYAVSSAVAGHRLDAPRCMGTLYWQLNDCWPAPTWSSIDYYGNWKALQYAVRDDYRTTAVLKKTSEKGEVSLFVKSDELVNQLLKVEVETFDLTGKSLEVQTNNIELKYQGNQEIWNQKTAKFTKDVLVKVTLNDSYSRDFLVSTKKAFNTKPIWLTLENVDLKAKTAEVKVVVKSFVADFWLYSMQTGVKFDRNFVNLLPGTHTFKIHFESAPKLEDFSYKLR